MIYLLLGTNMGDRRLNLAVARKKLEEMIGVKLLESRELETKAIGFDGDDFINQVVAFDANPGAEKLLDICQNIEIQMGRPLHKARYNNDGSRHYVSRIIDIDILKYNDLFFNTDRLLIPHPQVNERDFVKKLMGDITRE